MARVEQEREFDVEADQLWKTIGDFGGLDKWASGIDGLELTDGGKTRRLTVGGGATIVEHLVEVGERSYTYTLDPGGALPVVDYRSTISVQDIGNGRCKVHWTGEFAPAEGTPEEAAVQIVNMVYSGGLESIAKTVG